MKPQVYERRPGVWSVVVEVSKAPRRQKWYTVQGTKRQAQEKWVKETERVRTGQYTDSQGTTLAEWWEKWMEKYVVPNARPATRESYRYAGRFWKDRLGSQKIEKITPLMVQGVVAEAVAEGHKPATVGQRLTVLRVCLKAAVGAELIYRDPSQGAKPPTNGNHQVKSLSPEELDRVLEIARKTRWYLPVLMAASTGMRRGEVLALRWQDVHLAEGFVIVALSYDGRSSGPTKTKGSNRMVPLPDGLLQELRYQRRRQAELKLRFGRGYVDRDLVVTDERGDYLKPVSVSMGFKKIAKAAEVDISFHGLRSTHATMLIAAGIPHKVVQERLGHANASMTLDKYSAVTPTMQAEAVRVLNRLLGTPEIKSTSGVGNR